MRLHWALLTLYMFAILAAHGQRADERYVGIYNLIQQADALAENERIADSITAYEDARAKLLTFQSAFPRWNEKIVKYRLEYMGLRLAELRAKSPAAVVDSPVTTPATPSPAVVPAVPAVDPERLASLQLEIRDLQQENMNLEAKLKEALAPKVEPVDRMELLKARQAARELAKERDVLQVTLDQFAVGRPVVDPAVAAQERQILAEVRAKLEEQLRISADLRRENEELRGKLEAGVADSDAALELQLANAILGSLRSTNIALRTEKLLLEDKLDRAMAGGGDAAAPGLDELADRLEKLQARVQVYESKEVPYSAEELALFKQAPLQATVATEMPAGPKKTYELPAGAGPLITKARQASQAGRFDEAEQIYRQILRQDERNVFVLGHLAGAQIDQGHFDEAEQTLARALKEDPRDPSSLFALGMLKFEQSKFDEALDALSLSVQVVPEDARSHYYLGKTLVQTGNRSSAETALRKAVRLQPGMSPAHHALAVLYATQDPPFTELAQWHYQKALDGGYPKDGDLEKLLARQKDPE